MSARESSPSHDFEDTVDTAIHGRLIESEHTYEAQEPEPARERQPRRTDAARARIMQRRRQTLLALCAVLVLTLALAVFAGSWTWVLAAASGVATIAYLVHLRNEARREEERRLTREVRANRARPDVLQRAATDSQSSLAANAFVAAGPVAELEPVLLDDEDPELFDIAEAPLAAGIDRRRSEYLDSRNYYDWDDDADTTGQPATYAEIDYDDEDGSIRPAV